MFNTPLVRGFFVVMNKNERMVLSMLNKPRCRSSTIPQNPVLVNTFSEISPEGFNAQNKEFVKSFFEKNFCLPQAQNEPLVNSILKISYTFSKLKRDGGS